MINHELKRFISEWLTYLTKVRRYSAHTARSYSSDIRGFFSFLSEYHGKEISIQDLSALKVHELRGYLAFRRKNDISLRSNARALSAISGFFEYIKEKNGLSFVVIEQIARPKLPKSIPTVVEIEHILLCIKYLKEDRGWLGFRDAAILVLIYGTGCRISEALSIRVNDISLTDKKILFHGKGKKQRIVPILDIVCDFYNAYTTNCPYDLKEGKVFLGKNGKALDAGVFRRELRNIRNKYNLPEVISPHAFRRSFATHLLFEGVNLRVIQDLLGHSQLSTTEIYTKVSKENLLKEYKKYMA